MRFFREVGRDRTTNVYTAVALAAFLNAVWFIWRNRFLPLEDYPDWLYQGFILSQYLRHSALPAFSLKHYPVPYSTFTVALGLMDCVMAPETAGKILLTVMVGVYLLSSMYFLTSLESGENPLMYIPLVLCVNYFFFAGNSSYYLALGMFYWLSGYLLRYRLTASSAIVGVGLTLTFMTHLLPYLAALGLILLLLGNDIYQRRSSHILWAVTVICPSMLLLAWYVVGRMVSGDLGGPIWMWWNNWHVLAGMFVYSLSPFLKFLPFVDGSGLGMKAAASLNLVWSALAVMAIGASLAGAIRFGGQQRLVAVCALLFMLAYVLSGSRFASGSTGERFLLPSLWFACCWLGSLPQLRSGSGAMLLRLFLIAMVGLQIVWLDTVAAGTSDKLAGVYHEMSAAPDRDSFCKIYESYLEASWPSHGQPGVDWLLANVAGTIRLPYYLYIQKDIAAPIFPVGLLTYRGAGKYDNLCE